MCIYTYTRNFKYEELSQLKVRNFHNFWMKLRAQRQWVHVQLAAVVFFLLQIGIHQTAIILPTV